MNYLVSVGIATRNRQFYAEKTIRQIYSISEDIQIVVSDNSDDDSLGHMIEDLLQEDRIVYIYTPQRISVVENYDMTAKYSTGEYYICIGDDDIILSNIVDVAEWMRANGYDAAKTSREITYIWPGASSKFGRLVIERIDNGYYEFDCVEGVKTVLKNGCQSYIQIDTAGSYHALIKTSRMNELRTITGYCFSGFSPDIYNATGLSLLKNMRCVKINFPVSVPGSCVHSATNRSAHNAAISSVPEAISKYGREGYVWDERVPYYYTPETVWADTMLKALHDMDRDDLIDAYYNKAIVVNKMYYRWVDSRSEIDRILKDEEKELIKNGDNAKWERFTNKKSFVRKIKLRLHGKALDVPLVSDNNRAERLTRNYLSYKKINVHTMKCAVQSVDSSFIFYDK